MVSKARSHGHLEDLTNDDHTQYLLVDGTRALTAYLDLNEIAAPANPAANVGRVYVADDGGTTTLYFRDSAGTVTDLIATGGDVSAGANLTDNSVIRGDGGAKGVQDSSVIITDNRELRIYDSIDLNYCQISQDGVKTTIYDHGGAVQISAALTVTGASVFLIGLSANECDITNVGDIALDSISADAGGDVTIDLGRTNDLEVLAHLHINEIASGDATAGTQINSSFLRFYGKGWNSFAGGNSEDRFMGIHLDCGVGDNNNDVDHDLVFKSNDRTSPTLKIRNAQDVQGIRVWGDITMHDGDDDTDSEIIDPSIIRYDTTTTEPSSPTQGTSVFKTNVGMLWWNDTNSNWQLSSFLAEGGGGDWGDF